jgi:hypothetical protein
MTSKQDRLIASARAASGEDVEIIIRICGLNPARKGDWTVWIDEAGNRLRIRTDRMARIYPAKHPNKTLTTRDLYLKAPPRQIAKYSRWGLILHGRGGKSLGFLLGADDRLRLVYFEQGSWVGNRYPLEAGLRVLRVIAASCGYRNGKKQEARICDLPETIARFDFQLSNAFVVSLPTRNIIEGISHCQKATTK